MERMAELEPDIISIHAPRAGGDCGIVRSFASPPAFQSTPPVRGATDIAFLCRFCRKYFNPRPPCGGRQV